MFTTKSATGPKSALGLIFSLYLFVWSPPICASSVEAPLPYKGLLGLSMDGGYTALQIPVAAETSTAHGGTARLRLFYGLSDAFGIEIAGSSTWYAGFTPTATGTAENEDGDEITVVTKLPPIKKLRSQNVSLSIIYTLDIMKVIPYAAIGIVSIRSQHQQEHLLYVNYDVGLHADFGVDYRLRKFLWLGALVSLDTSLTKYSPFTSYTGIFFRATWIWQVRKLRPVADKR